MGQQQKMRVGLVYGGKSGEHEVSLSTAFAVMGAMDYEKYEIIPFYITKVGEWRIGEVRHQPFSDKSELTLEEAAGHTKDAMEMLFARVDRNGIAEQRIDVMFPLIHGTNGEDGTIQGLFEMANVPYVGAGVLASSVGMDKAVMKQVFAHAGLPQCKYVHFIRSEWKNHQADVMANIESELGFPCFIKPANLGSSVGISKARNDVELKQAIEVALRYDRKVIVEEFVDAREVEVSVLGNDEADASVPGEIVSSGEFYDYKAKYLDGKSQIVIPAPLDEELLDRLREMAVTAFRAIDGSGLSRVDFFVRRSDMQVFINEVNTMPGFTPFSMYPLMWKETGLAYGALLDRLIQLALERYEVKQQLYFENV
ncbi:D-alanine--D-alanine ligase [Paenibacillus sp. S-12]|uniref:D-alanine--D-alanine ligase n=1 Tax=Paenibacillus sp. S-12 TaxID=3031371 RepID=UPI0025A18E64|nr:D-alanine--D-alanine ligase [Paenibacillus sp. S-12]